MWFARGAVWHRIISIFGTEDTSVALRFAYLESTLFIIKEHPWGVGWYGYQFIYPEYDFYLNNPDVIMYHCNNLLLNITAELGWHGLAVFLPSFSCKAKSKSSSYGYAFVNFLLNSEQTIIKIAKSQNKSPICILK